MANVVIGHADRILGKFSQASSEAAGLPASNLATEQPSEVWRSADGVTTAFLLVNLESQQSIEAVALIATNLSASATWRVRLSTVDATGVAGNAHDSGVINAGVNPAYRMAIRVFSAPATGQYLRIDLVDATLPYLECGRWFAGVAFKPAKNFSFGARYEFRDWTKRFDGDDGQTWLLRGSMQRGLSFTLAWITDAERNSHGFSIALSSGRFRDVLVVLDTASADLGRDSVFGLLEDVPAWEMHFPGQNAASFRVMERL